MTVRFHAAAARELFDAVAFYESRRTGLGGEFLDEVDRILESVVRAPESFPLDDTDESIRVARTKRFPYGLIISVEEHIRILAVMHLHRRPGYWLGRKNS